MADISMNFPFNCFTPEVNRLISFHETPFPNDQDLSVSNSPVKFAKAGFVRNAINAQNDEVFCEACKRAYRNWEGESPLAVHIVIDEQCPFLNTPSADDKIQNHPLVRQARRCWRRFSAVNKHTVENGNVGYESHQLDSETSPEHPHVSVLSTEATFSFPFQPKVGDISMMFASRRLKTFTDPGCPQSRNWAEEGFVFKSDTSEVQCVFCAVVLPFDTIYVQQTHARNSSACPIVLMIDVGNITRENEERIQDKYRQQQRSLRGTDSQQSFEVCHPQYEEESHRLETYENWPPGLCDQQLQPSVMSEAGFWYTGTADKVRCYTCGVGLYHWKRGSTPWEQHALHKPSCPLLVQAKGQYFIQQAAQAQVLTEVDLSPDEERSQGVWCPQEMREMMMARMRAHDDQLLELWQQRAINHHQTALLEQKDIINDKQSQLIQHKDEVIQNKEEIIQNKDEQLQNKEEIIQHKDQLLEYKDQELVLAREQLETCRGVVRGQDVELERGRRLRAYHEGIIGAMQVQMQAHAHALFASRRQQEGQETTAPQAANPGAAAASASAGDSSGGGGEETRASSRYLPCTVCLSAECNTLFLPCHHITCCQACAQQLIDGKCPVCRAPVQGLLPAYIS